MDSRFQINKMIDMYGMDVKLYKREFTVDDNGVVTGETYSDTIETRAWVMSFGGLVERWEVPVGYRIEGDYSACFKGTVDVDRNHVVRLSDGVECEVVEVIKHYEGNHVLYLETILRRASGG